MKHAKKLASLLLVLVMVFALTATAFADGVNENENDDTETTPETGNGSITINNAVAGWTYNAYRILELESYSTDADGTATGNYAYKATQKWSSFINSDAVKGEYVNVDGQGYVTWIEITKATEGYTDASDDALKVANEAKVAEFARLAREEATKKKDDDSANISPDATALASIPEGASTQTTATAVFSNLPLGYYLVDSPMGALCVLDTTNSSVTMNEKNLAPSNEKKVAEDSKVTTNNDNTENMDNAWGDANDADIGQTVNFKSTITVNADGGAEKYVFHDKMADGLTFGGSVTVKLVSASDTTATESNVENTNYDFTDYTGQDATAPADECTFEVKFSDTFCATLKKNDKIVIYYTATLNENAVVGGNGNKNESWLTYGEERTENDKQVQATTTPSETVTYTWSVDVFKYTSGKDSNGNETKNGLSGVTFKLSTDETGNDVIKLVPVTTDSENESEDESNDGDDDNVPVYRVAIGTVAEDGTVNYATNATDTITTDGTGKFKIVGLDADTYYLTETATPAGYNKLAGPIKIVISTSVGTTTNGLTSTVSYYDYNTTAADDGSHYGSRATGTGEVQVLNQSGTELPSTGGMGTTLFYVIGGILVVAAVVLLITKKRMSAEK